MDNAEVENAMLVHSVAHPAAVERQCLHTAVTFNNVRFLSWGGRYDRVLVGENGLKVAVKTLQRISTGILLIKGCG